MAHADDVWKYEGPICDMCSITQFIGTCTHRPRKYRTWEGTLNGEPARGIMSMEYEQMARQKFQLEMRQKAHDLDNAAFFLSTRPLQVGEALGMNAAVRHLRQEAERCRAEGAEKSEKA